MRPLDYMVGTAGSVSFDKLTDAEARTLTLALAQYTIERVRELRTTTDIAASSRISTEIVECGGILNKLPRVRAPE